MSTEPRRLSRAQSATLRKVIPDAEVRAYRRDRDEPDNYGTEADRIDAAQQEAWQAAVEEAERLAKVLYSDVVARTRDWRMSDHLRGLGLGIGGGDEDEAKAAYRRATATAAREHAGLLRALADRLDTLAAVEEIRAEDHAADAATARFVDLLLGRER